MSALLEKIKELNEQHAANLHALIDARATIEAYDRFCQDNGFLLCVSVCLGAVQVWGIIPADFELSQGQRQALQPTGRMIGTSEAFSLNGFDVTGVV